MMGRGQGGGGRGGGKGGGGGVSVMTEDEFAYAYVNEEPDHSFIRSMNFRNKAHTKRVYDRYHAQIDRKYRDVAEGREVYRRLVAQGAMRPPTRLEKLQKAARGHPDNASTQAARTLLKRMGEKY